MIEVRAFSLGLIISLAVVYVLLLVVISRLDREPGFWALQAGSLAGFLGVLLIMLQGLLPSVLAFVAGNGLALITFVFFAHGLSVWLVRRPLPWVAWLLPILMMGVALLFGMVDPQVGPRILVFNVLLFVLSTGMGIFLWREAAHSALARSLRWLALAAFWLSVTAVIRASVWLVLGLPEQTLLEPAWQHVLPYVGQLLGVVVFVMLITAMLFSNLVERLRRQASLDPLTELLNRHGLRGRTAVLLADQPQAPKQCALMMMDLDRFKQVNDRYGHEVGDRVLQHLADVMRQHAEADDLPVRLGGEEFALLSFSADPLAQAEALRQSFAKGKAGLPHCTVSIGLVPRLPLSADGIRQAFQRADTALYQAKSNGRDRVETLSI